MYYTLIVVVSQDGFIAPISGQQPHEWSTKEEQEQFRIDIKQCNWTVMGRKTHEFNYNKDRSRVIFTSSVNKIIRKKNHIFFNPLFSNFSDVESNFQPNDNIGILGGTKVYDFFWEKRLITDIIITIEPVRFKKGLLLFSCIKINWKNFKNEMKKNFFKLKKEIILNKQGTIYLHYNK